MDLPQIWLVGITCDARAMLDGDPGMGVPLHAKPFEQPDRGPVVLNQRMGCAAANRFDSPDHASSCYLSAGRHAHKSRRMYANLVAPIVDQVDRFVKRQARPNPIAPPAQRNSPLPFREGGWGLGPHLHLRAGYVP